jgi:DNA-binding response OmpR family regulator
VTLLGQNVNSYGRDLPREERLTFAELLARVDAVYRRRRIGTASAGAGPSDVVVVDDVRIDLHRHVVTVEGKEVQLTRKEFQVLALLARSNGAVCTRSRIVAEVWGRTWAGANRTLDVHVATLRTKIGHPELVQTVRGVGYRLGLPETRAE